VVAYLGRSVSDFQRLRGQPGEAALEVSAWEKPYAHEVSPSNLRELEEIAKSLHPLVMQAFYVDSV